MAWRRGQPYGEDLRGRVLAASDRGMAASGIAEVFQVSVSYIYKALARRRATGETAARPQRGHVPPRLAGHLDALRARVALEADATLAELWAWLAAERGVRVGHAVLWATLAQLGLTLKKSRSGPPSRTARM